MASFTLLPTNSKLSFYSILGLLLLLGGLLVGLLILPFTTSGDGVIRYQFMYTLVHQLRVTPMRYSSIGPIFSLPLWLVSLVFKDPAPVVARYNFILFAIFILILYRWLKNQYTKPFLLVFLLFLTFGSMFPGNLLNYYGEVFSAACLALGAVGLSIKKRWLGWTLMILAVMNAPALFIPFTLVVFYMAWESRQFRYLALLPVCLILIGVEFYFRTGSIIAGFQTYLNQDHGIQTIMPYSGRTGYSYPFVFGVLSILLSFGKGLVFYCPGLLLAWWVWKMALDPVERKMLTLWFLIVLGLILAYATWWSWYGGWNWGPRFFLFASIPAAWVLAKLAHSHQKSLALSVISLLSVTLSLWVGVNGVVFQQKTLQLCTANGYSLESLCWYVPEFSPLLRPFIYHATLTLQDRMTLIFFTALWSYLVFPLGIELYRQIKTSLQAKRPILKPSLWKF